MIDIDMHSLLISIFDEFGCMHAVGLGIESFLSGAQKIKMRVEKFYFRFCGSFSGFYNL